MDRYHIVECESVDFPTLPKLSNNSSAVTSSELCLRGLLAQPLSAFVSLCVPERETEGKGSILRYF